MSVGMFASSLFGFIAKIPVDARRTERHRLSATPSDFALEDNSVASDHIVLNPDSIEISFAIRKAIIETPGVVDIQDFTIEETSRSSKGYRITATCTVESGDVNSIGTPTSEIIKVSF